MPIDETSDEVLSSLRSILHSVHLPDKECLGDILLQLITSTIEVIRRNKWENILMVHGPSSAEKTLGLAVHHLRRSQNTKLGFVDGKVKTRINRTLAWLSNKTRQELTG